MWLHVGEGGEGREGGEKREGGEGERGEERGGGGGGGGGFCESKSSRCIALLSYSIGMVD